MAQQRRARRSDGKDLPNRSVPFYVPGNSSNTGNWRRDQARFNSARRRSGNYATYGPSVYGSAGGRAVPEPKAKPLRIGLVAGVAFVLICVVALVGFVLASSATEKGQSSVSSRVTGATGAAVIEARVLDVVGSADSPSSSAAELAPPNHVYDANSADFLAIPPSTSVLDITLSADGVAAKESGSDFKAIHLMTSAIEAKGDCGFVFVDLDSGKGFAYNADKVMYVASAAKMPFVYWLLTSGIELDEYDREEVGWVIEDSDNDSFEDLFFRYYENGYPDYMEAHDVTHSDYYYDFYPRMSARSLASIWAEVYQYLQSGSEDARWLSGLLGITTTSFIRDGLYDAKAEVMNKAGWIGEESWEEYDDGVDKRVESEYCSVSDAGIIQANGHTYLMVIVTSQFDDEEAETNVSALARVLFDERASLQ